MFHVGHRPKALTAGLIDREYLRNQSLGLVSPRNVENIWRKRDQPLSTSRPSQHSLNGRFFRTVLPQDKSRSLQRASRRWYPSSAATPLSAERSSASMLHANLSSVSSNLQLPWADVVKKINYYRVDAELDPRLAGHRIPFPDRRIRHQHRRRRIFLPQHGSSRPKWNAG